VARKSKLNLSLANEIIDRLNNGFTLVNELKKNKVGYATWKMFCQENKIIYVVTKGKSPEVYTLEKAKEVKKRANQGEFVSNICKELGMNYNNFCRFCRVNDIKILTKKALTENIKRRNYGSRKRSVIVSRKDLENIVFNISKGSSLKTELAKAGFSYSTWRDRCLEFEIKPKFTGNSKVLKYSLSRIRDIKRKVKNGQKIDDVCKEFDVTLKGLADFCRSRGIQPPTKWKRNNDDSAKVKKVKKMLDQDHSPAIVAKKLSISSSYVYLIKRNLDKPEGVGLNTL